MPRRYNVLQLTNANPSAKFRSKPMKTTPAFYDQYEDECKTFNGGPIDIPKPDPKNGVPGKDDITLMFINERPGRLGAGKSKLISSENNDPSARRFKHLFDTLDIDRKKIFITNACIYYPMREDYRDKPPTIKEINFSVKILEDQIKRVKPRIIVTLGTTALRTLKKIYPELRHVKLKTHVAKPISNPRLIFPLYHTSNRAAITRKEKDQKRDWRHLKKLISSR